MQERHKNRYLYFQELAETSSKYFIPYIKKYHTLNITTRVLEVGCGDGGNLLPFSRMGCDTYGVDIAECRIKDAQYFFNKNNAKGHFIALDIFKIKNLHHSFDVIICHDVIEHIKDKEQFLCLLTLLLKKDGVIFMSFPAWQMPFGGHQQICRNPIISHLPWIHLLPLFVYKGLLSISGVDEKCRRELMSIRMTKTTIELFENLVSKISQLTIKNRTLYFINPHYKTKFGLRPRKLCPFIVKIKYLRNYVTTSCFYILTIAKNKTMQSDT